ncbi:NTP transferase domain-containing protein [Arthrobacter gengyunqii]|uniref:NTP transferase domain-containing protein n=1 Tax=Arthrobacter gengyunqii TaxID=2886940 RepID=A0A9X1S994_9MICC|nr:NTP transferase domain-containing protein [Arthrobacter gengyunqii]MCC3270704.1 NTP transferase domain-containing protein [Arthrobacter gengyunqii]UOY96682.1 NTP transferase domain-containing protein [Arthrobacter gengyunqii]
MRSGTGPAAGDTAYQAIILAGGRSSRLGGTPKALLESSGRTLLAVALEAASGARACAVAGPPELSAAVEAAGVPTLLVREEPPFSGPAAAVAAAWSALVLKDKEAGRPQPEWTLVLACDMPFIAQAVAALLAEARSVQIHPLPPSLLSLDETGREQPLAALYRTEALASAVGSIDRPDGLENLSMKRLLARVQWRNVAVPPNSTADIDTWEDAGRWSVKPGIAGIPDVPATEN